MHLGNRANIVINDKKIIFMMLKKCASVTMGKTILSSLGYKDLSGDNINKVLKKLGRISIKDAQELDYDKVVWVRNPLDRLVSGWTHRIKGVANKDTMDWYGIPNTISFSDFIDWVCSIEDAKMNAHFRQQTFDLTIDGVLVPNFIMKLEDLEKDWAVLRQQHPWLVPIRFHEHKTKKGNWKDYYTEDLFIKANKRFSNDLNLLGY
jgi:hypothetical protein